MLLTTEHTVLLAVRLYILILPTVDVQVCYLTQRCMPSFTTHEKMWVNEAMMKLDSILQSSRTNTMGSEIVSQVYRLNLSSSYFATHTHTTTMAAAIPCQRGYAYLTERDCTK